MRGKCERDVPHGRVTAASARHGFQVVQCASEYDVHSSRRVTSVRDASRTIEADRCTRNCDCNIRRWSQTFYASYNFDSVIDASSAGQWRAWIWNARDEAARLFAIAADESMQEDIREALRLLDDAERHLLNGAFDKAEVLIATAGGQLTEIGRTLHVRGADTDPRD